MDETGVVEYYATKQPDIVFVVQVSKSMERPGSTETLLDSVRAVNDFYLDMKMPRMFDVYYADGNGPVFRYNGLCAESLNGSSLFRLYKIVVPIGSREFVDEWNRIFGIKTAELLIRVPDSVLKTNRMGGEAYLCRGSYLRKKRLGLKGRFVSIQKVGRTEINCNQRIVRNTKREIQKVMSQYYYHDDEEVFLVSELSNWDSRWRFVVFDGEIKGKRVNSIDKTCLPDMKEVQAYVDEISKFNERAVPFIIEVGVESTDSGKKKKTNTTHLLGVYCIPDSGIKDFFSLELPHIIVANYLSSIRAAA